MKRQHLLLFFLLLFPGLSPAFNLDSLWGVWNDKTMHEQKTLLEDTMVKWKGSIEQVDDILVMGVRF